VCVFVVPAAYGVLLVRCTSPASLGRTYKSRTCHIPTPGCQGTPRMRTQGSPLSPADGPVIGQPCSRMDHYDDMQTGLTTSSDVTRPRESLLQTRASIHPEYRANTSMAPPSLVCLCQPFLAWLRTMSPMYRFRSPNFSGPGGTEGFWAPRRSSLSMT
jgi:hypothetical protein